MDGCCRVGDDSDGTHTRQHNITKHNKTTHAHKVIDGRHHDDAEIVRAGQFDKGVAGPAGPEHNHGGPVAVRRGVGCLSAEPGLPLRLAVVFLQRIFEVVEKPLEQDPQWHVRPGVGILPQQLLDPHFGRNHLQKAVFFFLLFDTAGGIVVDVDVAVAFVACNKIVLHIVPVVVHRRNDGTRMAVAARRRRPCCFFF